MTVLVLLRSLQMTHLQYTVHTSYQSSSEGHSENQAKDRALLTIVHLNHAQVKKAPSAEFICVVWVQSNHE